MTPPKDIESALRRAAQSRRQRQLRMNSYQEVVQMADVPLEDVRDVLSSLLDYFGFQIIREKTPDYTAYEVWPKPPASEAKK